MSSRALLLLVLLALLIGVGWFVLGRGASNADSARPNAALDGPSAAKAPVDPSAPTSVAPDARNGVAAPTSADPAKGDQREGKGAADSINGRALAEIKAAARDLLEFQAKATAATPPLDGGTGSSSIAEAQQDWRRFMEDKYNGVDKAGIERARLDVEAILAWQEHGPFASPDEQLSKDQIEVFMHELEWLQER